ncbi:MAG TPA: hypothetical protein VKB93_04185 [Thermoanaerobaculia bacterium]|nr:hypothetical protein [Thermoanaerobaculia bacterium]
MKRQNRDWKCSYVVLLDRATGSPDQVRDLARYLSTVSLDCEVVVLDPSPRMLFESNGRTLRWVGRHLHLPGGPADLVRSATAVTACEKVIVAADDVRYTPDAIERIVHLLDVHEAIEPQDYLDPLPWWSGLDAGRMLIHRGIEPQPDHEVTFAFRRSASQVSVSNPHAAADVFVRREPRAFPEWLAQRPQLARNDFALPVKTAFFLSLIPLLILFAVAGGIRLASGYAGAIAFTSVALALRGRGGAASFFPLRACLFAPLWVFERSVSVYWALLQKLSGSDFEPAATAAPDRPRDERVAIN